jgi:hypothetical protein
VSSNSVKYVGSGWRHDGTVPTIRVAPSGVYNKSWTSTAKKQGQDVGPLGPVPRGVLTRFLVVIVPRECVTVTRSCHTSGVS